MRCRRPNVSGLSLLLLPLLALAAGAGAQTSAGQAGPGGAVQEPSTVRPRMRAHFTHVAEIRDAIIRSDLAGVRPPATWLSTQVQEGLPLSAQPHVGEMQRIAAEVAAAEGLPQAAGGMARLAAACGNCHVAVKANPTLLAVIPKAEDETLKGRMRKHYRAAEHLYRGLVVPSSHSWQLGVEALSGNPVDLELTKSGEPSPEIRALARQLVDLAQKAGSADSQGARWPLYGQMLTTCAACHSRQGIVIPPTPAGL
jgi:cytochrome c553